MHTLCEIKSARAGVGIGSLIPVTDALMLEWSPTHVRSKFVIALIGTTPLLSHGKCL